MSEIVVNLMTTEMGTTAVGFVAVAGMVVSAVVRGLHLANGF